MKKTSFYDEFNYPALLDIPRIWIETDEVREIEFFFENGQSRIYREPNFFNGASEPLLWKPQRKKTRIYRKPVRRKKKYKIPRLLRGVVNEIKSSFTY